MPWYVMLQEVKFMYLGMYLGKRNHVCYQKIEDNILS